MSIDYDYLKNVDKIYQNLVNGYLHRIFNLIQNDEFYCYIPPLINWLCLGFYVQKFQWDNSHKYAGDAIHFNGRVVTNQHGGFKSVFLKHAALYELKRTHHWKFQISTKHSTFGWNPVGICAISKTSSNKYWGSKPYETYFTRSGYAFVPNRGLLVDAGGGGDGKKYGIVCNAYANPFIIEMILDFDKLTLSYVINGINYGIAFKEIEKVDYTPAFVMNARHYTITILQ
eukprot:331184_1